MKLSCEIIQDLLPLLHDGVCSNESRQAVMEHLETCSACAETSERIKAFSIAELAGDREREEKAVRKSFQKVRRRWCLSVIAVAMIIPIILLSLMVNNERKNEGVCFSNLNELWSCNRFLDALEDRDFETAVSYLDFDAYYQECREAIEMQVEDFMPHFEAIKIGAETYMAIPSLIADNLFQDDEKQIWSYFAYNGIREVPIPIEIWSDVVADGEKVLPVQEEGFRMPNGICYFPYETQWGTFMVVDTLWEDLQNYEMALHECFWIMPEDMYSDLEPEIEAAAWRTYEWTQERMKAVKYFDAESFEEYMEAYYVQELQKTGQLCVEDFNYQDAFYAEDQWYISYEAKISHQGQLHGVRFMFFASDGKIEHLYIQNNDGDESLTHLFDRFTPRLALNK